MRITIIALVLSMGMYIGAQQLTTVAVVDIRAVSAAFPIQSTGVLNLEALKSQYENQINEQVNRLEVLEREKAVKEAEEEYDSVIALERRIQSLKNYIDSLSKNFQDELNRRSQEPRSREFLIALQQSIEFTALDKGYSVVFQSTTPGLQWWADIVDITEEVIEKLRSILAQ